MLRHVWPSAPIRKHVHTLAFQAKWSTMRSVIDCTQGCTEDNIYSLHQSWQILRADGAHDKHRVKMLAEEKKKPEALCVTHVQSG